MFYISRTAGRLINEFFLVFLKHAITLFGNFLVNDFCTPRPTAPPPPIHFVHGSYMLDMDIIDHVAAALGPESVLTNLTRGRSTRPPSPY